MQIDQPRLRDWRRIVVVAVTGIAAAIGTAGEARADTDITIASGRPGGLYHPVAGAICKLVNEDTDEHGITCTVAFGIGSITNIEAMHDGEVTFAMAQSDTHRDALVGIGPFEEAGPFDDLRSVMSLFVEQVTIVTRSDKDIQTFADLKGKRVYPSEPGSGGYIIMQELFRNEGWKPGDTTEITDADLKAPNIAQALCDAEIDAFAITVGHPSPLVKEAADTCDVDLIPVEDDAADALVAAEPLYAKSVVPGGLYRGNPADVAGLGLVATLVTSADADADAIYAVTGAFFQGIDRLRKASPLFSSLSVEQMATDGLSAPLHEGAAQYYSEAGLR
ncbi:MAG: TAXI family TRAP transporter solute-binding subunit [Hyphomicrobiales bacterium]|nr:TAXI family TRAP transporter solute-binding subunit [Hyphomicrobiales bacterium]